MRQAHGYATILSPDESVEFDTIRCGHCQAVVRVKPGTATTVYLVCDRHGRWHEEGGGFCRVCMTAVCLPCVDAGRCLPWERQLEMSEAKDRLRRQVLGAI